MPTALRSTSRTRLLASLITLSLVALIAYQFYFATRVQAVSTSVVISQVYGGAGCSTAGCSTYKNDYIEIFNKSTSSVSLNGWSVQYASSAGTSWQVTSLTNVTLQPGQYYLVAEATGANGVNNIPTADVAGSIALSATAGKVALVNSTTALTGACPTGANIVDFIGYGSTANCFETAVAPAPSTANADIRNGSGCTETDNNSTDFVAAAASPRNTASALHPCTTNQPISPTCPSSLNTVQGTATSASVSATDPDGTVTSATITSGPVTGITLDSITPAGAVGGTASATLNVANTTASGTYNVTIQYSNNDSPTPQTADCTVVVTVNPPNQPITPSCPPSLNTTQGTAISTGVSASDPDGTVTSASITSAPVAGITLDSFSPAGAAGGTATATLNVANTTAVGTYNVTIQYSNDDSPTAQTASCTIVVTVNPPPGSVVISQVYGGGGNSGATLKNDFIEIMNHSGTPINLAGWSVQYISATAASGSWSVTPLTAVVLQPGQYYLIQEAAGAGGTVDLPAPDKVGTIAMGAGSGKVALVTNTTPLSGAGCPSGPTVLDLVGYGSTATCYEGAGPAPGLTNTTAELRKDNGCTDTDNNNTDFVSGAPSPRNTSSATNNCTALKGTGSADPYGVQQGGSTTLTVVVSPGSDPPSTGITVTADLSSIGGSATQSFSGSGNTFTYFATISESVTVGNKLLPVTITDAQGRMASTTIALVVQQPHIVISQIYGSGGNSGATYTNDFVELYNPTGVTFDLSDWSLQYASASGNGWEFTRQPLGGTIGPGEYYLISLGSGGAVGSPLPAANITSDINISGSNGKLALVSSFDPLVGNCPIGDVTIQDFVGYGAADCSETANAAGPINSTSALFRNNNGATDTDNNSSDFVIAAPSPRRTAPIVEIGPSVFGTDPRRDGSNAPRDASMTITFTEPVNVTGNWYNIGCATTGIHNDATIAWTGNFKTYVITPNVNFLAGEQCTVTLYKDQITDQDTDDSGTNTDTLRADYSWTFTVATGTAPPYPPSVHLTMGNPTGAIADINQPGNYLMEKPEFALSYDRDFGRPNWVSWHLTDEWIGTLSRVDSFRPDPGVPPQWYRVQATDFSGTGFDRGHMTPNADRDKETSIPINQATFLMSNMVAQSPDNNQGPWASLENYLRTLLPANELYIVSGPNGIGGTGSNGGTTNTIAGGHVTVPASTWKVVLVIPKGDNDLSRVVCSSRTISVLMPNIQGIRSNPWENYLTTVDAVENLTGYDFFGNLPAGIQNCVETGTNGTGNHPGTEGQYVTTNEETSVAITLTAESANANPLTYTIVSGPSHGGLTGADANRNYLPDPNYFGPDSFTFKVSDGVNDSNISTVNITVTNVQDAPDAINDSPTVAEDSGANTINVRSNDVDVDGDTLTVTAVTQGTNGTVAITNSGADVSYTPAANFYGNDSFTYTVNDGNGGNDTATVNVTVTNVNDAPVATGDSYVTNSNTTLNVAAPGVLGNDSDIDGPSLSAQLVSNVSHGTLTLNADGSFSYNPSHDYEGSDSFTYQTYDGSLSSNVVTVNITVNDTVAPVVTSSVTMSLISSTNSNLFNVGLAASATDNSGDPVTITVAVFGDEDDQTATIPGVIHSPDAKEIDVETLRLRGERVEANDGRVYLIIVTATDSSGNVSHSYQTVVVPKNNKQANIDSVNTQAANAVTYAQTHGGAPPAGYFVIGDGPIIGPKQ